MEMGRRRLHNFMKLQLDFPGPPSRMDPQEPPSVAGGKVKRGSVSAYPFSTTFACLAATVHSRSLRSLRASATDHAKAIYQLSGQDKRLEALVEISADLHYPSIDSLCRSRIKLDVACMLAHRARYESRGPFFRWIAFDASPQRSGIEVFASSERILEQRSLDVASLSWPKEVQERRLPLATLAQGRAHLSDKVQAHIHQCWLEYGGNLGRLRAANCDVRGTLSDCGTELGIGDYADVLGHLYGKKADAGENAGHLYPLALVVPGPQHIIDTVIRTCLDKLTWWSAWSSAAKVVCQWLASADHRDLLRNILMRNRIQLCSDSGPQDFDSMVGSLENTCDKFAEWRWKTLASVTADLKRLEHAVRTALSLISDPHDLGTREARLVKRFMEAVRDEQFWGRAKGLAEALAPLTEMSSWLRGCPCHGRVRLARCPWAGCRAFQLAARLRSLEAEITKLRMRADVPVGMDGDEWVDLHMRTLAFVQLKFSWVHEAPYTVWQLLDPQSAQRFITDHDAQVRRGETVHRVSHFLAGKDDAWTLRRDLEAFARGSPCSQRLWSEVQAYRMCPLDETHIEAAHRDISHISRRANASKIAFRASAFRIAQNITACEVDNGPLRQWIERSFWRATAVLRNPCTLPLRSLKSKSLADVVKYVYRLGDDKFNAWCEFERTMGLFSPRHASALPVSA